MNSRFSQKFLGDIRVISFSVCLFHVKVSRYFAIQLQSFEQYLSLAEKSRKKRAQRSEAHDVLHHKNRIETRTSDALGLKFASLSSFSCYHGTVRKKVDLKNCFC